MDIDYSYSIFIPTTKFHHLYFVIELDQVVNLRPGPWVARDKITKAHQNGAA